MRLNTSHIFLSHKSRFNKALFLIPCICITFLIYSPSKAQEIVYISDSTTQTSLSPFLETYEDVTGNLQLKEVISKSFTVAPEEESIPEFGYSASTYWARVTLENTSPNEINFWIEFDYALSDNLELYIIKENGTTQFITGDQRQYESRSLTIPTFAFPLSINSEEPATIYIRQKTTSPLSFPVTLWKPKNFTEHLVSSQTIAGLFYGIMIVMVAYNLFLFFTLKSRAYLLYVLLIGSEIGFQAALDGMGFMFVWKNWFWFNARAMPIMLSSMGIFLLAFTHTFLNIRKNNLKSLDKVIIGLIIIYLVNFTSSLFVPYNIAIKTNIFLGLSVIIICIVAGVNTLKKGFKPARFFLLAWSVFLAGMFLQALRALGILPSNFMTMHSSQLGSIFEVIALSVALADRINTLQKEVRTKEQEKKRLIEKQKEELETQVQERTAELVEANEELNQQKEEINAVNNNLQATVTLVEKQRDDLDSSLNTIQKQQKNILDSINYARRIQQAILPSEKRLANAFPEHFVFFRPREAVSGDFFWISDLTEDESCTVFAVADCTGHGVPGAFMSMIGNNLLNHIVNQRKTLNPADILTALDKGIFKALNQEETNNRDGMDITVIVWDKASQKLHFAGAKNPLIYIKNNELQLIKGDKMHIGGLKSKNTSAFQSHTLSVHDVSELYLFSDGFQDQIGGADGRKFMSRTFRDLLLSISGKTMSQQKEILIQTFDDWKQVYNQVDDVIVVGLKLS